MSQPDYAIAYRNSSSAAFRVFRVDSSELVVTDTADAPASQVLGGSLSPDNRWVSYGQASGSLRLIIRPFDFEAGVLGANSAVASGPDGTVHATAWSADSSFLAVAHDATTGNFSGKQFSIFSHDGDGGLAYVAGGDSGISGPGLVSISPDNRWVLVESDINNSTFRVFEFDGAALTQRGQLQVASANRVNSAHWLDGQRVIIGNGATAAFLCNVDNDGTPTLIDSGVSAGASGDTSRPSTSGRFFVVGGSSAGAAKVGEIFTASIEELWTIPALQVRRGRFTGDGQFIVGASGSDVFLFSWDGAETALLDTKSWSSTIQGLMMTRFAEPPPTAEELFRATFAEASGNPPLETALINPQDVQRLINHNVSLWAGKPGQWRGQPKWYRFTAQDVRFGQLDKTRPGQLVFVKKDVPGLREGKWLLIMGRESESSRPGPVNLLCMGWEPDGIE